MLKQSADGPCKVSQRLKSKTWWKLQQQTEISEPTITLLLQMSILWKDSLNFLQIELLNERREFILNLSIFKFFIFQFTIVLFKFVFELWFSLL